MSLKFQIGEVVRFADNAWNRSHNTANKLATIVESDDGGYYQTAITFDEWIRECNLLPVNGGIPSSADDCISRSVAIDALHKDPMGGMNFVSILEHLPGVIYEPAEESLSDLDSLVAAVEALDAEDYFKFCDKLDEARDRRVREREKNFVIPIVKAIEAYYKNNTHDLLYTPSNSPHAVSLDDFAYALSEEYGLEEDDA